MGEFPENNLSADIDPATGNFIIRPGETTADQPEMLNQDNFDNSLKNNFMSRKATNSSETAENSHADRAANAASSAENESNAEKEVSPSNVKELLNTWISDIESPGTDEALKKELGYKILKMEMALSAAKLSAEEVHVIKGYEDAYGLYDPADGSIALTETGLELPAEHFADVLVHESAHAGKLTGKRLMDEGIAEWRTLMFLPTARQGIYQAERDRVTASFGAENKASVVKEKYDYDRPTQLAKWFLETELTDRFRHGLKGRLEGKNAAAMIQKEVGGIERLLEKTVPDLYHKLKANGFEFSAYGQDVLKRLQQQ